MGRKEEAVVHLSGEGKLGPIQHDVARAEAYLRAKWHLDQFSRLDTIDMGRKLGSCCALFSGELGPHATHCGLGRGLPHTKWHLDP